MMTVMTFTDLARTITRRPSLAALSTPATFVDVSYLGGTKGGRETTNGLSWDVSIGDEGFKDLVQGQYITILPDRIVINRKPPAKW